MRRIQISHITRYEYSCPVRFLTHKLHIRPREGHYIRIESLQLTISPDFSIGWQHDIYGNSVALVNFLRDDATLLIANEAIVQNYHDHSLHYPLSESATRYPFYYDTMEQIDLFPYQTAVFPEDNALVRQWLGSIYQAGSNVSTMELLDRLNHRIADQMGYIIRDQPGVQTPAQTLTRLSGSCRDVSTLFIEACRALGLASRFVSGYLFPGASNQYTESTHAWAEVYLPGAGWRGFDSTSGNRVGGDHIAVAHHRHPQALAPISGAFLGAPDSIHNSVQVQVKVL